MPRSALARRWPFRCGPSRCVMWCRGAVQARALCGACARDALRDCVLASGRAGADAVAGCSVRTGWCGAGDEVDAVGRPVVACGVVGVGAVAVGGGAGAAAAAGAAAVPPGPGAAELPSSPSSVAAFRPPSVMPAGGLPATLSPSVAGCMAAGGALEPVTLSAVSVAAAGLGAGCAFRPPFVTSGRVVVVLARCRRFRRGAAGVGGCGAAARSPHAGQHRGGGDGGGRLATPCPSARTVAGATGSSPGRARGDRCARARGDKRR